MKKKKPSREPRRRAANAERVAAKQKTDLDEARLMAVNKAFADSHTVLSVIEEEYLQIQKRLDVKDKVDIACLQAALLIAYAQEYTRSVLATAPAQMRGIGKDFIFKKAQDMRAALFAKVPPQTDMPPPPEGERTSAGGIILLGDAG